MPRSEVTAPWPLPARVKFVEELTATDPDETHSIFFQNQRQTFRVFKVPVDFPVYRLANGRTLAPQEEYIATHGKQDDFFTKDPESAEALAAQHEILKSMIEAETDELLVSYFRDHEQVEPLILDHEGYVINGNRRLCTYRCLLADDEDKFARYQHVRVIFLPPCTEEDKDVLEAALQVQPELRAKFDWVATAKLLRQRQRVHNWSPERLSKIHDISIPEITRTIDMLDYADQYLVSRNTPKQYSKVGSHEFAFREITEGVKKLQTQAQKDAFVAMAFSFVDKPEEAGTRLYSLIQKAAQYYPQIAKAAEEEFDHVATPEPGPTATATEDLALLGGLAETTEDPATTTLTTALKSPDNIPSIREIVKDTIDSCEQQKKESQNTNYPLKQVTVAHTSLASGYKQLRPDSKIDGMEAQLAGVEEYVKKIREWLTRHASD